jgi:hypothetical protein
MRRLQQARITAASADRLRRPLSGTLVTPQSFLFEQSPTNEPCSRRITSFRSGWKRGF